MKKIAIIIPNLESGGSERIASRLSKVLISKYDVLFIIFDGTNISYDVYGQVYDLKLKPKKGPLKYLTFLFRLIKTKRILNINNVDLIFSFTSSANKVLKYLNTNIKKVFSCRGYKDFIDFHKEYHKMIKKNSYILFNSNDLMHYYQSRYPEDYNNTRVIYNIFDVKHIRKLSKEEIKTEEQKFFDTHKTIITVSHFSESKGHWHLLKSFEILKEQIPNAGLILVGHRGNLENKIKNMASQSKYSEDILFVGYQNNPFKYIARADVYSLCSLNEGFPNALIEAMICECPVVATNCMTGPSEILFNDYYKFFYSNEIVKADNGILVPPFSAEIDFDLNNKTLQHYVFADALSMVLESNSLSNRLKNNSYLKVNQFDEESIKEQYFMFIDTLLSL